MSSQELALVASHASSTPDNNLPPTVSTISSSVSAGPYHIPPVSITSGLGKPLTLSSSVPCPTTESIQTRPSNPYDSLQLPNTYRNHGTKRGGAFQSLNVATNIADRVVLFPMRFLAVADDLIATRAAFRNDSSANYIDTGSDSRIETMPNPFKQTSGQ